MRNAAVKWIFLHDNSFKLKLKLIVILIGIYLISLFIYFFLLYFFLNYCNLHHIDLFTSSRLYIFLCTIGVVRLSYYYYYFLLV